MKHLLHVHCTMHVDYRMWDMVELSFLETKASKYYVEVAPLQLLLHF